MVRAEVPVLRLQFARGARRGARSSLHRRARLRSRARAAVDLGPSRLVGVHRRWHAEPVFGGGDRPPARVDPGADPAPGGRGDHAGGESRHVRANEVRGLS